MSDFPVSWHDRWQDLAPPNLGSTVPTFSLFMCQIWQFPLQVHGPHSWALLPFVVLLWRLPLTRDTQSSLQMFSLSLKALPSAPAAQSEPVLQVLSAVSPWASSAAVGSGDQSSSWQDPSHLQHVGIMGLILIRLFLIIPQGTRIFWREVTLNTRHHQMVNIKSCTAHLNHCVQAFLPHSSVPNRWKVPSGNWGGTLQMPWKSGYHANLSISVMKCLNYAPLASLHRSYSHLECIQLPAQLLHLPQDF